MVKSEIPLDLKSGMVRYRTEFVHVKTKGHPVVQLRVGLTVVADYRLLKRADGSSQYVIRNHATAKGRTVGRVHCEEVAQSKCLAVARNFLSSLSETNE